MEGHIVGDRYFVLILFPIIYSYFYSFWVVPVSVLSVSDPSYPSLELPHA